MFKKIGLTLFIMLHPSLCFSQNINAEINFSTNNNTQKTLDTIDYVTDKIDDTLDTASQTMIDNISLAISRMSITIISIEENKKLPVADLKMADAIKNSLLPQYSKNTETLIDEHINEVAVLGAYKEDNSQLNYKLSRNLSNTLNVCNIMRDHPEHAPDHILDLDEHNIEVASFTQENIDGKEFLIFSNLEDKKTFATGNIGAYLNFQVQTFGNLHTKLAEDFIKQLDYKKLQRSISDDGKDIKEICERVHKKSQDPEIIERVIE